MLKIPEKNIINILHFGLLVILFAASLVNAQDLTEDQRKLVAESLGITVEELGRVMRGEQTGEEFYEVLRRMNEGAFRTLQNPHIRDRLRKNLDKYGNSESILEMFDRNTAELDTCLIGRWTLDLDSANLVPPLGLTRYSGRLDMEIQPLGAILVRYRKHGISHRQLYSEYEGEKRGCVEGHSFEKVHIDWHEVNVQKGTLNPFTGVMSWKANPGPLHTPSSMEGYRCEEDGQAIHVGGWRYHRVGNSACENLAEQARARFHILGPGDSGHPILDGWWLLESERGMQRKAQRVGLVRGRAIVADEMTRYLQEHADARRHVEDTVVQFAGEPGPPIDVSLVLAMAARESGHKLPLSRGGRLVVSSGGEVHPRGEAGLDYLYRRRSEFPKAMQKFVQPVNSSELTSRGANREAMPEPARVPERLLLAAFVVEARHAERGFIEKLNEEYTTLTDSQLHQILDGLTRDALRAWTQLHFGTPNGVRIVLRELLDDTPEGSLPDLNRLLTDTSLRNYAGNTVIRFSIRRALVTAAEAWLIEQNQEDCGGGCVHDSP